MIKTNTLAKDYQERSRKRLTKLTVGLLICSVGLIADILIGPSWLTIQETFTALFKPEEVETAVRVIVWTFRFPATLMALGVGAALGIAGAVMQTILDNPLASPYTLGISAGAGFGAALAIVFGSMVTTAFGPYLVPICAFLFAMLTSFVIYLLGKLKGLSPATMVLSGIGLSFLFQALQSLLQYISTPEVLQNIVFWLFGSLTKSNWFTVTLIYIVLSVVIPAIMADSWRLTALKLGDEKARGLGINVERLRVKMFILVSILTSAAVAFVGIIGFIGLVGPHVARMLVGEDQRFFVPLSAVFGAALLSFASIGSKVVSPGAILPIGIVTALIGVPFYFSLILRGKRGWL